MIIVFTGHSDDVVEWAYGASLAKLTTDEHCVEDAGPISYAAFRVATIGGTRAVTVHAIYGTMTSGTWAFAYGQAAEGGPIPAGWAFTVERAHDYSVRLVIDTCDDLVEVAPMYPQRNR